MNRGQWFPCLHAPVNWHANSEEFISREPATTLTRGSVEFPQNCFFGDQYAVADKDKNANWILLILPESIPVSLESHFLRIA
jgi:hypothetical protein